MTQIISVITQDYALLVSDRLLTYGEGPRAGETYDDNTCKLVSLCNMCGIGYSGLAMLGGIPTHEWIAKTLAARGCRDANSASQALIEATPRVLRSVRLNLRRQIFLIAGWAHFGDPPSLRPHFCIVSNFIDESGQLLATPHDAFVRRIRALKVDEAFLWYVIGQPLAKARAPAFERNLRQLVSRDISPSEALRLLTSEILFTNQCQGLPNVGRKMLGFCIPGKAVESQLKTGRSAALAKLPDEHSVAFTYFDPVYSELKQYGPTFICGEFAATNIETENDEGGAFQSSQMRLLAVPKKKT